MIDLCIEICDNYDLWGVIWGVISVRLLEKMMQLTGLRASITQALIFIKVKNELMQIKKRVEFTLYICYNKSKNKESFQYTLY
jgi:hypothetical protein